MEDKDKKNRVVILIRGDVILISDKMEWLY